jgi:DNA-directed RNA polymerase subunit omega
MIEALKDDKVINQLGGRFKFTSLVQHRVRELMEGARPLVERRGRNDFEVAVQEVVEGKIAPLYPEGQPTREGAEAEPAA